jgi:hypothetical protein
MSKLFIAIAALSLMACDTGRTKAVPGWAERDAAKWATALGYTDAKYTCVSHTYAVDGAAAEAICSVVMDGKVYSVMCDGQTNQCWVEK